jgi:AcrR family transcriptional regulator
MYDQPKSKRRVMRQHGWAGDLPSSDEEAVRRILDASRACIDLAGDTSISEVARRLGVTRQTVYRYFRTTEDLLIATAIDSSERFLERLESHLGAGPQSPAEALVEAVAYTLEQLPEEPYMGLLLTPGRIGMFSRDFTSPTAMTLGRSMLERFPVDWGSFGFRSEDLDDLLEHMLRLIQSFVIDPGTPTRRGKALRDYLARWLGDPIRQRMRTGTAAPP